jgi:hypothetical protein
MANCGNGSKSPKIKIDTLVLHLRTETDWNTLKMIHDVNSQIGVANFDLRILYNRDLVELEPAFDFQKGNLQDKICSLEIAEEREDNDPTLITHLQGFSNLKLKRLAFHGTWDENLVCDFISNQPTVTMLDMNFVSFDVWDCASQHFPLLTVLKLGCLSLDEFNEFREYTHCLTSVASLELTLDFDGGIARDLGCECDISFIANLPSLQKFTCSFDQIKYSVKMEPSYGFLSKMKEFP